MSGHCHDHCDTPAGAREPRYRRILWAALIVNAAMFVVEVTAGLHSGSVSLLADAIDFFGDAANYGLSLAVLNMALVWRARTAVVKGMSMLLFGLFVAGRALWALWQGTPPQALTMGLIGALALVANVGVALALYRYREGDANMRSVWLCTRNDALSNVAVMAAAVGVFGTGSGWPDLAVAAIMAALAITAGTSVVRAALAELKLAPTHA